MNTISHSIDPSSCAGDPPSDFTPGFPACSQCVLAPLSEVAAGLRPNVRGPVPERPRQRPWGPQAAVLFLLAGWTAQGGSTVYTGAVMAEPAVHHSYVRDSGIPGTRGPQVVADDVTYAADLKANVTAGSVDNLFTQCYGGGFLDDLLTGGPGNFTAASAARWNETAYSADNVLSPTSPSLDNYTRAWRDAASARSGKGFFDWYQSAVTGTGLFNGSVSKDPFASPAEGANLEHPMYATPDVPTGGANDTRTLIHNAAGPQQYAILVAWDQPDPRHVANLARIFWLLRNQFNVPGDNIVTLLDNQVLGNTSVNYKFLDSAISGPVFFDGNNRRPTWIRALKGVLFATAGTVDGTNIPKSTDKLFIYSTGHGLEMVNGRAVAHNVGDPPGTMTASLNLTGDGFTTGVSFTNAVASSVMDTNGNVLLQLQLSQQINPDALISVQGVATASAGIALVTDPTRVYNYNGLVDNAVTYQVELSEYALSLAATNLTLSLSGLQSPYVTSNLVLMTSFIGGDQELVYNHLGLTPKPPSLSIAPTTTNSLAISWPSPATGFVLQQNADLTTTNWVSVTQTPNDDGANVTVVVGPPVGAMFYRLKH